MENNQTTIEEPTRIKLVYTVKEAARELGLGPSTVRERIVSGRLRSFKDGGRRLIAGEDLLDYVNQLRKAA